jgi:hypothetical protein
LAIGVAIGVAIERKIRELARRHPANVRMHERIGEVGAPPPPLMA